MRRTKDAAILGTMLGLPVLMAATLTVLAAAPARVLAAGETGPPGKEIFLAQKCSLCHSVGSQGIEAQTKSEKIKGPDLSNVGGSHLAPWITQWLKKEVANTDGKKHPKEWKGTDAELQQLVDWLASLKKA